MPTYRKLGARGLGLDKYIRTPDPQKPRPPVTDGTNPPKQ